MLEYNYNILMLKLKILHYANKEISFVEIKAGILGISVSWLWRSFVLCNVKLNWSNLGSTFGYNDQWSSEITALVFIWTDKENCCPDGWLDGFYVLLFYKWQEETSDLLLWIKYFICLIFISLAESVGMNLKGSGVCISSKNIKYLKISGVATV